MPDNFPTTPEKSSAPSGVIPSAAEQRLREDAGQFVDKAKAEFADIKAEAEHEATAIADEAKEQIGKAVDKAKGLASKQKDLLSEQLTGVAGAVSKVADELEAENSPTAGYARSIADGMQRFTSTIQDREVDDLLAMAEDFGRKQPAAFMAAAAIAGFVASRFLMASAKRREPATSQPASSLSQQPDGAPPSYSSGNTAGSGAAFSGSRDTIGGSV